MSKTAKCFLSFLGLMTIATPCFASHSVNALGGLMIFFYAFVFICSAPFCLIAIFCCRDGYKSAKKVSMLIGIVLAITPLLVLYFMMAKENFITSIHSLTKLDYAFIACMLVTPSMCLYYFIKSIV
jgi:hypothetical protein